MSFDIEVPEIPEWDKKTKLNFEREMVGDFLDVSDHPLSGLEAAVERAASTSIVSCLKAMSGPTGSRSRSPALLPRWGQLRASKKSG